MLNKLCVNIKATSELMCNDDIITPMTICKCVCVPLLSQDTQVPQFYWVDMTLVVYTCVRMLWYPLVFRMYIVFILVFHTDAHCCTIQRSYSEELSVRRKIVQEVMAAGEMKTCYSSTWLHEPFISCSNCDELLHSVLVLSGNKST